MENFIHCLFSKVNGVNVYIAQVVDIEVGDLSVFASFEAFRRFQSPFCLGLIEAFTTHQHGRAELVVVYENHPGAVKLDEVTKVLRSDEYSRHIQSWISQLLCLLFSAHQMGLVFDEILRMENLILTVSNEKVVLSGFGIPELLYAAGNLTGRIIGSTEDRQAKDYENLRKIIDYLLIPMVPRSDVALRISKWMSELPPVWKYSLDQFGRALISCAIHDTVIISISRRASRLEAELAKQLENDRLFRIMAKFCFINERQSYAHDQNWSETGDRYVLKLFRDFVFQSQDESGRPIIDFMHVIDTLNKLDTGSHEMLMLSSRRGDQCIFATYADIKQRLDSSFEQLIGS